MRWIDFGCCYVVMWQRCCHDSEVMSCSEQTVLLLLILDFIQLVIISYYISHISYTSHYWWFYINKLILLIFSLCTNSHLTMSQYWYQGIWWNKLWYFDFWGDFKARRYEMKYIWIQLLYRKLLDYRHASTTCFIDPNTADWSWTRTE